MVLDRVGGEGPSSPSELDEALDEPTSWTDEYRRIYELFERTLRLPGCTDGGGFSTVRGADG